MTNASDRSREFDSLQALRNIAGFSQSTIASNMGITQPSVHKIEKQTDIYLSTMFRYAEALGGEVKIQVCLPDVGEYTYSGRAVSTRLGTEFGYDEARTLVVRSGNAKVSHIQRELKVGYNDAKRWIELMESEGVVGPPDRMGRREVYSVES